ncbi:RNA signal recognition particle [Roseateles aquatilis]|uniref:RNA signal recognition particle n=1 Tax=Roseateles aquatilis TaxID=431061 RepID=A0A246JI51_9BURK|nr:DUF1428 domain-containing protein [Roseateles aquatilis]OWQ92336.1 RNA signal recognition particle [Roseateles aquatilis]
MSYVDGFVLAVPNDNKEAYRKMATEAAALFKRHGALSVVECWGDDVPEGKVTSFTMAVKRAENESVVFSWVEWPSKAVRDTGMQAFMEDPIIKDMKDMPFDGQRMIFGGFTVLTRA